MEFDRYDDIDYALRHTELVRAPRQKLTTFGVSNVHYYLLTEPMDTVGETRVREGRVLAEKPRIVTAGYFVNALEGFGEDARAQAIEMLNRFEMDPDILEYKYTNELGNAWVLSEKIGDVVLKLANKIDEENDAMGAVLKGPDDAWQISLMKFIFDLTRSSLQKNMLDLSSRGLFERRAGIPKFVRDEIDEMFRSVEDKKCTVNELGSKLQSYGIFEQYQDRFFALFGRR